MRSVAPIDRITSRRRTCSWSASCRSVTSLQPLNHTAFGSNLVPQERWLLPALQPVSRGRNTEDAVVVREMPTTDAQLAY